MQIINLIEKRFGRLAVIARAKNTQGGQARWECRCDCGQTRTVTGQALRTGHQLSCGCLKAERIGTQSRTHGEAGVRSKTPEYGAWANMIQRCTNPNLADFNLYGGRGITVCARWRKSFMAFLKDMGRKPSPRYSLDRIDNNKGYNPNNCRWATAKQQAANKRTTKIVQYRRRRIALIEAWEMSGKVVPFALVHDRLKKGWPAEAALNTPVLIVSGKRERGSRHWAKAA